MLLSIIHNELSLYLEQCCVFLISLVILAAKFSSCFCERKDLLAWSVSALAEKIPAVPLWGFSAPTSYCLILERFYKDAVSDVTFMLGANTIINWTTVKSNGAFVAVAVAGLLAYLVSGSLVDRPLSSHMEKTNKQRANTEQTDSGHNPAPPTLTALSPVLGSWRAMSSLTVKNKTDFSLFYEVDTLWLLLIYWELLIYMIYNVKYALCLGFIWQTHWPKT